MSGFGAILRPRAGGKTHDLLDYLQTNPAAIFITPHMAMRTHVVALCRKKFGPNPDMENRIITIDGLDRYRGIPGSRDVLMDDADVLIPMMLERLGLGRNTVNHVIISATGVAL